jgi:hypothetical protein
MEKIQSRRFNTFNLFIIIGKIIKYFSPIFRKHMPTFFNQLQVYNFLY